jgi:hypothetical protein
VKVAFIAPTMRVENLASEDEESGREEMQKYNGSRANEHRVTQ